jgi:hypothetical protein
MTVDYMVTHGALTEIDRHWQLRASVEIVTSGVPESLRQLIEKHIERLSEDQQWHKHPHDQGRKKIHKTQIALNAPFSRLFFLRCCPDIPRGAEGKRLEYPCEQSGGDTGCADGGCHPMINLGPLVHRPRNTPVREFISV